jgi:hypothetical protein
VRARGALKLPFPWINVRDRRAFVSGHGPQNADGTLSGAFGKVGADVTVDQGYDLARKVALSMLGSLKRELGDLDRGRPPRAFGDRRHWPALQISRWRSRRS